MTDSAFSELDPTDLAVLKIGKQFGAVVGLLHDQTGLPTRMILTAALAEIECAT